MSYASGVTAWDKPITLDEIYDVEEANAWRAVQPLWRQPGTKSGYPWCYAQALDQLAHPMDDGEESE